VRAYLADEAHQVACHLVQVCLIQAAWVLVIRCALHPTVTVVQSVQMNPQRLARTFQFLLSQLGQRRHLAWRRFFVIRPGRAIGNGTHVNLGALACIAGQRSAQAKRFVVGMSKNG
jgi:hypothetical protein